MTATKNTFDGFLKTQSISELRALVANSPMTPNPTQVQQLIRHAKSLKAEAQALKLGIVHTYTSELLDPWFELEAALQGFELQTYHAPYGVTFQEAHENSGLSQHSPDITLIMLRREDLHPELTLSIAHLSLSRQNEVYQEVLSHIVELTRQFRRLAVGQIVFTLLPAFQQPSLGIYDAQSEQSENVWWARLKTDIGTAFRNSLQSTLFLDLDELMLQIGRKHFFDGRFWYSARFPFTPEAAREITQKVIGIGAKLKSPVAKVIALDADNTLWGGVIGEDGLAGIALGPDYPGNVYMDFQRRLLDYQQRGFILALCSKNNPGDLDQVLQEHPHQILRDHHFAARRVNWAPKPDNLISLAKELNLGLDSFIFVDDSHHECEAVRYALPQIEVIQVPNKLIDLPCCLDRVARLEVLSLTSEDTSKTEMYVQERSRREFLESCLQNNASASNYLESLAMNMQINLNCQAHLTRLSQLTQKTNQFNLTTRRYNEQQIQEFIDSEHWLVADFSLADKFGDNGIVGLAIFELQNDKRASLDTFLMSCRVIGREAEGAFLHALLRQLAKLGFEEMTATFIPTPKNAPSQAFLPNQGFKAAENGQYVLHLTNSPPHSVSAFPIAVQINI